METKDTCLYIHTRKSDGGIFYVGIGDSKRPTSKRSRNKYWRNTVNIHDYYVTILKTCMSWEEACDLEIKMIAFYGRKDLGVGCLVNMTNGGEGTKGVIISEEKRKKISETSTGRIFSEETKQKLKEGKVGEKNPMFGKGNRQIGEKNHRFGTKNSEKSNQKRRESMDGKMDGGKNPAAKKVICIVTNKIYGCITDAAKDNGFNRRTLSNWLTGKSQNKSFLRFL